MQASDVKFKKLKYVFRIIIIRLKQAGIGVSLGEHQDEFRFRGVAFFEMRRESRIVLCEQPVGEYLRLAAHLPHVNRRAENECVGMRNRVMNLLHVVVEKASPVSTFAAEATLAWFDVEIVEMPGLYFSSLFFRTFKYFVDGPGGVAFLARAGIESHHSHFISSMFHSFPRLIGRDVARKKNPNADTCTVAGARPGAGQA